MKINQFFCAVAICIALAAGASAQPHLSYYLPENTTYDQRIPTPASVLGHEVGEFHVSHDNLVRYMRAIDEASDRVTFEITGYTHEKRPLILLTITSPENHRHIESIRSQHVLLTDPSRSGTLKTEAMPAVFYLGCSIHGNEASGTNASLLIAYHLAAAQGPEIETLLQNTIILLDPSFNPDGMQRFSSWVNSRRSRTISADPNDMEHNEAWPGGRTNHYWFDLNRDWLVAQQPESQARITKFHQWKPNVLTDHHEMGSNATFFFQPGVPSRTHPLTPQQNVELTRRIGQYHAKALDKIGSLYYTQEGYDDFYYGKGSTFPDIQGAIGILFEQASPRGHAQESINGVLTFPFAIRNQFTAMLSSLEAIREMRVDILNYQRQFYRDAVAEAAKDPVKAIVFGSRDKTRAHHLAEIVARQDISIHRLASTQTINGKTFNAESSFVVPMNQRQYRLIKGMFEKRTQFADSIFYDISAWTLTLAAGVEFEEMRTVPALGDKIDAPEFPMGSIMGERSEYAYAFEPYEFYTPRAMYRLLDKNIRIKVATVPFHHPNGKLFPRGSVMIPVSGQSVPMETIEYVLREIVEQDGIDVHAFPTGLDYVGVSLGSGSFVPVRKPEIAILVGDGISSYDAGEMWHLLDTRFTMPVTMLPIAQFNRTDLSRYNTIIFPPGNYRDITDGGRDKLKLWIQAGGTAIGLENALNWFGSVGLGKFDMKRAGAETNMPTQRPYADINSYQGAQQTDGAIFEATVDLTHPLLYGYYRDRLPLFKGNNICLERSGNPYANPIQYTESPLLAGYVSKRNYNMIKGGSVVGVSAMGRGRVIGFTENLAFRAFWFGTNRLLMNAIFLGPTIDSDAGR